MSEQIDWNKAPAGTTGAMRANFDSTENGGKTWKGKIEWLPFDGELKDYAQGNDAWQYFAKPTWNGAEDGLPPVGLEVETVCAGTVRVVQVLHKTDKHLLLREASRNYEWLFDFTRPGSRTFRPIRTAEQLAAEAHRAKYMPQLIKLWDADTQRTEFLEAVYAMLVEAGKP